MTKENQPRRAPPGAVPLDPPQFWPDGSPVVGFPVDFGPDPDGERQRRKSSAHEGAEGSGVGYGRPPREHQFQPGQSGNPHGRPLGAKNKRPTHWGDRLTEMVRQEAYREVTLREGHGSVTLPVVQAVLRSVSLSALKGKVGAQRLLLEGVAGVEAEAERQREDTLHRAVEIKAELEQEVEHRARQGITDLSDLPVHPDDIVLDLAAGTARIEGPVGAKQQEAWHALLAHKDALVGVIEHMTGKLKRSRDPQKRADALRVIETAERDLAQLAAAMPDWVDRRGSGASRTGPSKGDPSDNGPA